MRAHLACLPLIVACHGNATSPPVASTSPASTAPTSCDAASQDLGRWLAALAAEGHANVVTPMLAEVAEVPSGFALDRRTHYVEIGETIAIDFKPVDAATVRTFVAGLAATRDPADSTFAGAGGAVVNHVGARYAIAIDQHARWRTVVALVDAIRDSGVRDVDFVFRASKTAVSPPPPSSIDADVAALGHSHSLAQAAPSLPDRVFARCSAVTSWLPSLANQDAATRDRRVVSDLPGLVASCSCDVELPAVRRLMWAWWGRDQANPTAFVATVTLDAHGAAIAADGGAEWSAVASRIDAASKQRQPIALVSR